MISESALLTLIEEQDFLMEGIEKSFFRFIKLNEPEVWDNVHPEHESRVWVIALMGHFCIYYVGSEDPKQDKNIFCIGTSDIHGKIDRHRFKPMPLQGLLDEIISSRYNI